MVLVSTTVFTMWAYVKKFLRPNASSNTVWPLWKLSQPHTRYTYTYCFRHFINTRNATAASNSLSVCLFMFEYPQLKKKPWKFCSLGTDMETVIAVETILVALTCTGRFWNTVRSHPKSLVWTGLETSWFANILENGQSRVEGESFRAFRLQLCDPPIRVGKNSPHIF